MLHDEFDAIAALPTTKALEDVTGRGNRKGRGLLVVEGAKADQVAPTPPQGDEVLHNFLNPSPFQDIVYTLTAYHGGSKLGLSTNYHKYENILLWIQFKDTIFVRQMFDDVNGSASNLNS
jgi:hypothetical protein